jgi:hypothetical protein
MYSIHEFNDEIMFLQYRTICFNEKISDMLVADSKIFIIQDRKIYRVNSTKEFLWYTTSDRFDSLLLFPTITNFESVSTTVLIYSIVAAIIEFIVMFVIAYFLNLRIYKTNSGKFYIEQNQGK